MSIWYLAKVPAFILIYVAESYAFHPPTNPPPKEVADREKFGRADMITKLTGWFPTVGTVSSRTQRFLLLSSHETVGCRSCLFRATWLRAPPSWHMNSLPKLRAKCSLSFSRTPLPQIVSSSGGRSLWVFCCSQLAARSGNCATTPSGNSSHTNLRFSRTTNSSHLDLTGSSDTPRTLPSSWRILDSSPSCSPQARISGRVDCWKFHGLPLFGEFLV